MSRAELWKGSLKPLCGRGFPSLNPSPGLPQPLLGLRRMSQCTHKSGPEKTRKTNTGNLDKIRPGEPQWSHKWSKTAPFSGGAAEMKTVLPCTREHNFQGFGGSGFGPFRHPFPNLCQRPPKTTQNTKNYKNQPPKWYPVSCRSCPGIALWGPWIPMVVSK